MASQTEAAYQMKHNIYASHKQSKRYCLWGLLIGTVIQKRN